MNFLIHLTQDTTLLNASTKDMQCTSGLSAHLWAEENQGKAVIANYILSIA